MKARKDDHWFEKSFWSCILSEPSKLHLNDAYLSLSAISCSLRSSFILMASIHSHHFTDSQINSEPAIPKSNRSLLLLGQSSWFVVEVESILLIGWPVLNQYALLLKFPMYCFRSPWHKLIESEDVLFF